MNIDEVKSRLRELKLEIKSEENKGNSTQLKLTNGLIVNAFQTGSLTVQGKDKDGIDNSVWRGKILAGKRGSLNRNVFVVYGHDNDSRKQLEYMLKDLDFKPIILDKVASEGQTVIEKLENNVDKASFGVVLLTPDDVGYSKSDEHGAMGRARQNVVLEMGMLLAKFGRRRVFIFVKDQTDFEKPSDIAGLIYLPFKSDIPKDVGVLFLKELKPLGIEADVTKL
ncbi:TIR domain-containing protein [Schleiferilactobacillus perolens]|nr:TIR domain-containing protein [Schleiferilactobacillus perolens]